MFGARRFPFFFFFLNSTVTRRGPVCRPNICHCHQVALVTVHVTYRSRTRRGGCRTNHSPTVSPCRDGAICKDTLIPNHKHLLKPSKYSIGFGKCCWKHPHQFPSYICAPTRTQVGCLFLSLFVVIHYVSYIHCHTM